MNNLQFVKKLKKIFNLTNDDSLCVFAYCAKNRCNDCDKICSACEFFDVDKCIDYLLQEHKEPIKLKQWEFDLIKAFDVRIEYTFEYFRPLKIMNETGYFSDINNTSMTIREILENCEIVPDDYDFGGNENE